VLLSELKIKKEKLTKQNEIGLIKKKQVKIKKEKPKKHPKRNNNTLTLTTHPYNSNQSLLYPTENFHVLSDFAESNLSQLSMIENILFNLNEDESQWDVESNKLEIQKESTEFDYYYTLQMKKSKDKEMKTNLEKNYISVMRPYLKLEVANDIMENKYSMNEYGLKNGDIIHVPFSENEKRILEVQKSLNNIQK
jgi:hypothetical protein